MPAGISNTLPTAAATDTVISLANDNQLGCTVHVVTRDILPGCSELGQRQVSSSVSNAAGVAQRGDAGCIANTAAHLIFYLFVYH